ncbi:MAG: hypothetical protein WAW20_15250 [Anaerolineae bacterium]
MESITVQVLLDHLALPKAGNSANDYEDAAFPLDAPVTPVTRLRAAIADGATESSFAALWARLLVEAFVQKRLLVRGQRLLTQLAVLHQTWRQAVASKPLPWYAEEKLRDGAFCAFLGLELAEGRRGNTWQAWAVGDSCLLHVRGDTLLVAFPLTTAEAFNSRPLLIGSQVRFHAEAVGAMRRTHGAWQPGDRFFLLTDALAAWFLAAHAAGDNPTATLEGLLADRDTDALAAWLADTRRARHIRNDDTTLLRITLLGTPGDA